MNHDNEERCEYQKQTPTECKRSTHHSELSRHQKKQGSFHNIYSSSCRMIGSTLTILVDQQKVSNRPSSAIHDQQSVHYHEDQQFFDGSPSNSGMLRVISAIQKIRMGAWLWSSTTSKHFKIRPRSHATGCRSPTRHWQQLSWRSTSSSSPISQQERKRVPRIFFSDGETFGRRTLWKDLSCHSSIAGAWSTACTTPSSSLSSSRRTNPAHNGKYGPEPSRLGTGNFQQHLCYQTIFKNATTSF